MNGLINAAMKSGRLLADLIAGARIVPYFILFLLNIPKSGYWICKILITLVKHK
jgi:hypothetical protein